MAQEADQGRVAAQEGAPPAASAAVEATLATLVAEFGERLGEDERAQIRERLERQAGGAAALAAEPLANADEPDFVFSPYSSPYSGG